jgi:integrase
MASSWINARTTKDGKRYRVMFRVGGREAATRYAGSFVTKREALARRAWVTGELAAMRVPDLATLIEPTAAPTFAEVAKRWQASRVDVRDSTLIQHRTALGRVTDAVNATPIDRITPADVASLVAALTEAGKARESIRKTLTAVAMVLDYAGVAPNPARDRVTVKLPREERDEIQPPDATAVEAVAHLVTPAYLVALAALDVTGCRVGEMEAARIGDLDEDRKAWLIRSRVSKTKASRWATMPADVFDVLLERLPAREDRDPAAPLFADVTADRLRTAIARACRDASVATFSPHDLRHRRISLLHRQGVDWATIGARVGQRNLSVTADTYTHAMVDPAEANWADVLVRARTLRALA